MLAEGLRMNKEREQKKMGVRASSAMHLGDSCPDLLHQSSRLRFIADSMHTPDTLPIIDVRYILAAHFIASAAWQNFQSFVKI